MFLSHTERELLLSEKLCTLWRADRAKSLQEQSLRQRPVSPQDSAPSFPALLVDGFYTSRWPTEWGWGEWFERRSQPFW